MTPTLLFVLSFAAQAREPVDNPPEVIEDKGLEITSPYDYETNLVWTKPPFEGFRHPLAGSVDTLLASIAPVEAGEGTGNLVIVNQASGWTDVHIGDTFIGALGPLARATLYDLPAGTYEVSQTITTGYKSTARVETCGDCVAVDWVPGSRGSASVPPAE